MFVTLQYYVLLALSVAAFGLEVFALVDAITRKSGAFVAAGKLTKQLWLIINVVAAALGFIALPPPLGQGFSSPIGMLSVVAVVAAAVYVTDVRPAVRGARGGGGRSGPYGQW